MSKSQDRKIEPSNKLISLFKCRMCNEIIQSSPLHIDWYTVQDLLMDAKDNVILAHRCNEDGQRGIADLVGAIREPLPDDDG